MVRLSRLSLRMVILSRLGVGMARVSRLRLRIVRVTLPRERITWLGERMERVSWLAKRSRLVSWFNDCRSEFLIQKLNEWKLICNARTQIALVKQIFCCFPWFDPGSLGPEVSGLRNICVFSEPSVMSYCRWRWKRKLLICEKINLCPMYCVGYVLFASN